MSQKLYTYTIFSKTPAVLGEGAWWDACEHRLIWIDIEGKQFRISSVDSLHQFDYNLKKRPGTIVPTNKGNFVLALEDSIVLYNLRLNTQKTIATIQIDPTEIRFNEGKCDAKGRLWVGTMDCKYYSKPVGKLYRIDADGSVNMMRKDVTISNGITWSPDNKTMYYIDSPTRLVKAFDFDLESGVITNERVVIQIPDSLGTPDGCTIDSKGNLWIAQWGGGCVTYWDTNTGKMLDVIKVPALNVTSVALGGSDLKELYITTASIGMTPVQQAQYPQAGHVFVCKVKTAGINSFYWIE